MTRKKRSFRRVPPFLSFRLEIVLLEHDEQAEDDDPEDGDDDPGGNA
jgi:hypothetical protein